MTCLAGLFLLSLSTECAAKQWSLRDCIDYALANNIQLQKAKIKEYSALEDVKQSQAALLPSLNLSTSQNVNYTPWPQQGRATVADGYVQSSVDKVYYNGSYSLSGNWTVWNGNKNRNNVKLNKVAAEQARLDSATTANNVLEQIESENKPDQRAARQDNDRGGQDEQGRPGAAHGAACAGRVRHR